MPYASGATPVWTVYTYDALGRTVSVTAPDGHSTTQYIYQGNTVKVTDSAGNWKLFTMDTFGNLTQVTEPDPAHPLTATYITTYTYDLWNNLSAVSMVRPTGTQTRTFNYSGKFLQNATNPENGMVSYTYNANNQVIAKTDAKGQKVAYSYDTQARLTQVQRYATGSSTPDPCQQETYYYDTNPFSGYSGLYTAGRLTAVQYFGGSNTYGAYSPSG
jgi:YD repeat-containing protein